MSLPINQVVQGNCPYQDETWLYEEYVVQEKSTYDIAKEQGVNSKTVYNWLKKFNIRTRPRGVNLKGADNYMKISSVNPFFGKHHSEQTRKLLSEKARCPKPYLRGEKNGMYGKRGLLSPTWKGGITKDERLKIWHRAEAMEWRRKVFERDTWTCVLCGDRSGHFHAHHIKSFTEYPELRWDVDNGLTLCKSCHLSFVHSKRKEGNN